MLTWVRAVDRWNLTDRNGAIVAAVANEVLARAPELFERERVRRGWPEIHLQPRPEVPEWQPLSLSEVIAILDGDPC